MAGEPNPNHANFPNATNLITYFMAREITGIREPAIYHYPPRAPKMEA